MRRPHACRTHVGEIELAEKRESRAAGELPTRAPSDSGLVSPCHRPGVRRPSLRACSVWGPSLAGHRADARYCSNGCRAELGVAAVV